MFNLEQSIIDWRRQMLAAGIKTPVPLDELESHLREEIEQRIQSGTNAQQAFDAATRRVGQAHALKSEFNKIGGSVETRFVELAGIACGLTAGAFSLWLLLMLLTVHETTLPQRVLGLIAIAAIILSWRYGGKLLPIIHRQRARAAAGALCCLASIGGMALFIKFILPHLLDYPVGGELPVGRMLVSFAWAWAVMAILGGAACGLEKTTGKNNEQYV